MKGFTLLELVVASVLAALMGVAGATVLVRGLGASRRAEVALQELFLLEKTAERLGGELRNAVALADTRFSGSEADLSFVSASGPKKLMQIRYRLVPAAAGQALLRETQPMVPDAPPVLSAVLLKQVVTFSVVYGMIEEVNGRPALKWAGRWDNPTTEPASLPELVRVRLETRDLRGRPYSVTREFLIPHGVLKESAA